MGFEIFAQKNTPASGGNRIAAKLVGYGVPAQDARILSAVARGESGLNPKAYGDRDLGGSVGLFQIHLPAHADKLKRWTGSNNRQDWVSWLENPENNIKAAAEVYKSQGLGAWTVYNTGAYKEHLGAPESSVAASRPRKRWTPPNQTGRGFAVFAQPLDDSRLWQGEGPPPEGKWTDADLRRAYSERREPAEPSENVPSPPSFGQRLSQGYQALDKRLRILPFGGTGAFPQDLDYPTEETVDALRGREPVMPKPLPPPVPGQYEWRAGKESFGQKTKRLGERFGAGVSEGAGITPFIERILRGSEQKAVEEGQMRPEYMQFQGPHAPIQLSQLVTGEAPYQVQEPLVPEPTTTGEKIASGLGHLVGMLGPVHGLYGVGGKLASRLIPKAAASLPARIGRAVTPGAFAGSVYEGGHAALEGKPLPEVGKEAAIGAALFGGGDIALRGLGKAAMAALRRARASQAPPPLSEVITPPVPAPAPPAARPKPVLARRARASQTPPATAPAPPAPVFANIPRETRSGGTVQNIRPTSEAQAKLREAIYAEIAGIKPETAAQGRKPSSHRLPDYGGRAMAELNEAILDAQNLIRHKDVLAAYPPGTTVEQALADLGAKTGKDFLKLADAAIEAQSKGKLQERLQALAPSAADRSLAQAAGILPESFTLRRGEIVRQAGRRQPTAPARPERLTRSGGQLLEDLPAGRVDVVPPGAKAVGQAPLAAKTGMPASKTKAAAELPAQVKTTGTKPAGAQGALEDAAASIRKTFDDITQGYMKKRGLTSAPDQPLLAKEIADAWGAERGLKPLQARKQFRELVTQIVEQGKPADIVFAAAKDAKNTLGRIKAGGREFQLGTVHVRKAEAVAPGEVKAGELPMHPQTTRIIQRGKHGSVRAVFPDEGHALLFDLVSASRKAAEGRLDNIGSRMSRVRHLLKLPEGANVSAIASDYRKAVLEQAKALEKGIIFRVPKTSKGTVEKLGERLETAGEPPKVPETKTEAPKSAATKTGEVSDDIQGMTRPAPAAGKAAGPEVLAGKIESAKKTLKEADDVLKVDETPNGPTMLYSGIPVEKVAESVKTATVKLLDNLGIAGEGVTVVQPPAARQPGLLTPFKSPTQVAKKYREVKPYVDGGIGGQEIQERLRAMFDRRLKFIDKVLAAGKSRIQDPLRKTYKQNKTDLQEILLVGDMIGKKFTSEELRSAFGAGEAVIKAYRLTRAAYDHAHAIASRIRELRGKMPVGYREGYISHFFHNWFIVVDGQLSGSARTLHEAVAMSNPVARASGAKIEIRPKQFEFPGGDVQAAVIGDLNYFKLKGKIGKDFGISLQDAQSLLEGVARMKGRSRFVGNFLQRKGAQGWEKNLDWVNRHYFNMISRYAALDGFKASSITRFEREFGAFDKEHKGVAKYIKDYINDVNGNPTAVEELLNNTMAKVPGINQFFGKYLGNRPSLQLAGGTTNAVAIAKLGLYNVSSALINATQLLNTNALLGAKWTAVGLKKAMLRSPAEKGILKQIGVDVQMGIESGAGYSKAAQVLSIPKIGDIFNKSTFMFQATEKLMRRTAGLGSYYKALSEGKTRQQAIEYAKETIRRTQFEYGIADAPGFIRRSGPLGQVLFQFKKFPIKELEFMSSLKGAERTKFWIPFALLSGYYAMPGFESLNNTVKGLFDINIDLEAKKYLAEWAGSDPNKKAIARTIAYGIGSQAGIDISHRVGAGDFIPSEIKDIAGPAFSTVVRAAQMAAKGNWIETARAISPAPGNLAQVMFLDGEITNPWDRERLKIKLTPQEKAVKTTGFMSIRESLERDVKNVKGYAESRRRDSETKAIDNFIKAEKRYKITSPGEEKAQALKELNEKRAKLKELKITPKRVKEEKRKKTMTSLERAKENVPKKRRKEYERIDEFAK